jgi:hypothetical protein
MSDGGGRSGISPWLVAAGAFLWFRRSKRREQEARGRPQVDAGRFMRDIVTEDGRPALQVQASLYEPDPSSTEQWVHVRLEGSAANQEHLAITLQEAGGSTDVVAVMAPLGTRRRVNSVDCYVVGGLAGHLPPWAVTRWGAQLRAVHLARGGQPSAVHARIVREPLTEGTDGPGMLGLDVLMPEAFEVG